MLRVTPLRSSTAATISLVSLFACGSSHETGKSAPASAAASPAPAPATSASLAPSLPAARPMPEPVIKVESTSSASRATGTKGTVATVNGTPIPAERVYSVFQMNKQLLEQRGRVLSGNDEQALKAESLEVVLAEELLYQAATSKGLKAPQAEVESTLKQFKTRVGSEEAYKKYLADRGITEAEVRKEIERNIQTETYRRSLLAGRAVSESDAKKYYDANSSKGMFNVPEQVHVQFILVKSSDKDPDPVRTEARKRAEEAARRAAAGEDFTALAKQYSQDPTAARGGDVGFVPRGVLFPQFEQVAFAAKPGVVSGVFETPKGFNVMKVLEKKPESTRSYDDVKQALMAEMGRLLEQDVVQGKIQELAAAAKIAVLDNSFAPPATAAALPPQPPPAKP